MVFRRQINVGWTVDNRKERNELFCIRDSFMVKTCSHYGSFYETDVLSYVIKRGTLPTYDVIYVLSNIDVILAVYACVTSSIYYVSIWRNTWSGIPWCKHDFFDPDSETWNVSGTLHAGWLSDSVKRVLIELLFPIISTRVI